MNQGVQSPSLSGQATEFNVGGSAPYSDALWNNHLIGPLSSQGMFDTNQTQVPALHDFTYDVYFYGDNLGLAQALEFDINQFFDNLGFIFGQECRIASGDEWDVWDNQNARWTPTGIPCYPEQQFLEPSYDQGFHNRPVLRSGLVNVPVVNVPVVNVPVVNVPVKISKRY
jgi:hypothetical protein